MESVLVSPKFQIVIPRAVREALRIRPGQRVQVIQYEDRIELIPDELQPEYEFDYRKARPNRFAGQVDKSRVVVMLDPDISEVFTTPESVNAVLHALIKTMPFVPAKPARRRPPASARKPA